MAEFNVERIWGCSGSICYPHPIGRAAEALPETNITLSRISRSKQPFLFRGTQGSSYAQSLRGALIEEVRRRRGNYSFDDYPLRPEALEGFVNVSRWEYRDLDLYNATLQGFRDEFGARTSIVGDPGTPQNYRPWWKLFHWVYGERQWPGGVLMPSAAGEELTSIVVPREIARNRAYFECVYTEEQPIPPEVIAHVLGHAQLPADWTPPSY
jgi:hypothetical protein